MGTSEVAISGRSPLAFDEVDDLVVRRLPALDDGPAGAGGIVVLSADTSWGGAETARVVVSVAAGGPRGALETLRDERDRAVEAGWLVAHAGILHLGGRGTDREEGGLLIAVRPGDALADELDNGPLSLALDPLHRRDDLRPRPARVLIASYEVAGPTGNGGIGTAYHSLAHTLAAAGHDVTLLFTGWIDPQRGDESRWREEFARGGVDFRFLGTPWDVPARSPHHAVRRAYELHRWLADAHAERPFDVVHVPETLGHGAFALTAKALGLDYADVEFVVGTHSSTRWVAECNREAIEDLDMLVTERLERISVERADVLMSPTAYLLDYMRARGWSLPERTFVQPLARPQSVRALASQAHAPAGVAPRELIFFGRLETRKGLEAFCDALDLLVADGDCPFERITFVGRPERVLGEDATAFVNRRAQAWDLPIEILPDLGHAEAVAYLRTHPAVVAIPSLVDNSPNTVIEVLALGVPFVASRSGGTGELIGAADLAASTFDGWAHARGLEPSAADEVQDPFDARALATALRAKAAAPTTPIAAAVDDDACDAVYDRWHRAVAGRPRTPAAPSGAEALRAGVVLLADDADDVRRVVGALDAGTRTPVGVVAIGALPARLDPPGVDVEVEVAQDRETGAARRRAVARLDADVVIVLRGDDLPDPSLVASVCGAMASEDGPDVLSLVCRDGDPARDVGTPPALRREDVPADLRAFVPAPGPAIAAIAYPALSVGPYAFRRAAVSRVGGYSADAWGETLDHELLARVALAGLRIDVLPDPVATSVRDDGWSEMRTLYWGDAPIPAPHAESLLRLLRPFLRRLDGELQDLPALFVGALRAAGRVADLEREEADRRQRLVDAYELRISEFTSLSESYEERLAEHRELIALYERQKAELHGALRSGPAVRRLLRRLRHAARGPVHAWPDRGVRFTRRRIELLTRRNR